MGYLITGFSSIKAQLLFTSSRKSCLLPNSAKVRSSSEPR